MIEAIQELVQLAERLGSRLAQQALRWVSRAFPQSLLQRKGF